MPAMKTKLLAKGKVIFVGYLHNMFTNWSNDCLGSPCFIMYHCWCVVEKMLMFVEKSIKSMTNISDWLFLVIQFSV